MTLTLDIAVETFPIAGTFTISRGSRTEISVVRVVIAGGGHRGQAECVPYPRYGESVDGVVDAIRAASSLLQGTDALRDLQACMPPGAARNAVDCALWDLEAKQTGKPAHRRFGLEDLHPVTTAYTLSLGTPEAMQAAAAESAARPLLKIKLGGDGDADRIRAVRRGAPESRLIVDANEAWPVDQLDRLLATCREADIALIEQPLPAGADDALRSCSHDVPICADESAHTSAEIDDLVGKYDAINIKLDKTGGLTEAHALLQAAKAREFKVMIGCMVGTSLGMAPAMLVAQDADFVDLDGPLLLARDRKPGLTYEGSTVYPPLPELWG
ncbi:MAG: N-acetyl-D-Glu racemase DgcA [Pseudomonadota bacterium]